MSLFSLQQGKVKKSKKSMKIVNIEGENLYTLDDWRNCNEVLRKDLAYDKIKSPKKTGFHSLPRDHIFLEKPQGESN